MVNFYYFFPIGTILKTVKKRKKKDGPSFFPKGVRRFFYSLIFPSRLSPRFYFRPAFARLALLIAQSHASFLLSAED